MRKRTAQLIPLLLTVAIVIAIMLALMVPLALTKDDPLAMLQMFFLGPFGSLRHLGNILEAATPIMLTGLAATIIFRSGLFNLGIEGGFFLGGLGATACALMLPVGGFLAAPAAILFGAIVGSFACTVPGYLKLRHDANEMVVSLVLNYAFLFAGLFFLNYVLRDPNAGALMSMKIPTDARLERLMPGTRLNSGVIIAFLACIAGGIWLYASRSGLNIRIVGSSPGLARHLGLPLSRIAMSAQLLGGLVAGMAGAIEVLGLYPRFSWVQLPGHGWTGIIVAILARENPLAIIPAALFVGYLQIGGDLLARNMDIPNEVVGVITAVVLIGVTANAIHRNPAVLMFIRRLRGREETV